MHFGDNTWELRNQGLLHISIKIMEKLAKPLPRRETTEFITPEEQKCWVLLKHHFPPLRRTLLATKWHEGVASLPPECSQRKLHEILWPARGLLINIEGKLRESEPEYKWRNICWLVLNDPWLRTQSISHQNKMCGNLKCYCVFTPKEIILKIQL